MAKTASNEKLAALDKDIADRLEKRKELAREIREQKRRKEKLVLEGYGRYLKANLEKHGIRLSEVERWIDLYVKEQDVRAACGFRLFGAAGKSQKNAPPMPEAEPQDAPASSGKKRGRPPIRTIPRPEEGLAERLQRGAGEPPGRELAAAGRSRKALPETEQSRLRAEFNN